MKKGLICVIFALKVAIALQTNQPCLKYGSYYVCTVNAINVPEPDLKSNQFILISTSMFGIPFSYIKGNCLPAHGSTDPSVTYLEIDRRRPYRQSEFLGFGTTLTQTDLNILKRTAPKLRDAILKSHFSSDGMRFDLLQMSMAEIPEFKEKLKIKEQIQTKMNKDLKLIATIQPKPWIFLEKTDNRTAAQLKFVDSLAQNKVWSIFVESNRLDPFNMDEIKFMDFMRRHLNGTKNSEAKLTLVDNTENIQNPWIDRLEYFERRTREKFDMICLGDNPVPPEMLCRVYRKYQKPIVYARGALSESKTTSEPWPTFEKLIRTLISLLQRDMAAFINNAMVSYSNATFAGESLILIDKYHSKMIRTPNYYAIAHFSKYIVPGSMRVNAFFCGPNTSVQTVAYLRPDSRVAVILFNPADTPVEIGLVDKQHGEIRIHLKPKSINTLLYAV